MEKKAQIGFNDWISISQSFSMAGADDERLWKLIEERMKI